MLKDKDGRVLSRSEGESIMKNRSSVVISICAAALALAVMLSNGNSSRILNDTLSINDQWSFFQSKSIKQTMLVSEAEQLKLELKKPGADTAWGPQKSIIEARIQELESQLRTAELKLKEIKDTKSSAASSAIDPNTNLVSSQYSSSSSN